MWFSVRPGSPRSTWSSNATAECSHSLGQHRQVVVLNGERRSRGVLKVGDKIRIGTATIIFQGQRRGRDPMSRSSRRRGRSSDRVSTSASAQGREERRSEIVSVPRASPVERRSPALVEIFRSRMRSDLVPSLRALFSTVFAERRRFSPWSTRRVSSNR